jgi:hypothetical protein
MTESQIAVYIGAVIGFGGACLILYPELRRERSRAAMLEKMVLRHDARVRECKTGAVKIVTLLRSRTGK